MHQMKCWRRNFGGIFVLWVTVAWESTGTVQTGWLQWHQLWIPEKKTDSIEMQFGVMGQFRLNSHVLHWVQTSDSHAESSNFGGNGAVQRFVWGEYGCVMWLLPKLLSDFFVFNIIISIANILLDIGIGLTVTFFIVNRWSNDKWKHSIWQNSFNNCLAL